MFQFSEALVRCDAERGGIILDISRHLRADLILANAAYGGKGGQHGDVLEVVQLAEDTQLREFHDAGDEDKLKVRVAILQRRI